MITGTDFDLPIRVRTCVGEEPRPCSKDVTGPVYASPASAFAAALKASGLSRVDLMIGMGGGPGPRPDAPQSPDATLTVKEAQILHPRYFLPTHWNATPAPILKGLDKPYKQDPALSQWFAAHDVTVTWPAQFFDRWVLDTSGLHAVDNHEVKARLGLADVQVFETGR